MNLHALLRARAATPIRVGIIGCGKFGSMFLAQARRPPGLHVLGVADREVAKARKALSQVGWPDASYAARSVDAAGRPPTTAGVLNSKKLAWTTAGSRPCRCRLLTSTPNVPISW